MKTANSHDIVSMIAGTLVRKSVSERNWHYKTKWRLTPCVFKPDKTRT